MFQVCRAKCFRCARQVVSGVSGKVFRVCRARCFRCAGQDVSGVPGKIFQVTTDKMFQPVRRVRCFRCAGQRCHVRCRARGGRYAARCFRCVGQRLQHEPFDHIPVTVCCAESGRTLGGDCLATQVRGKW